MDNNPQRHGCPPLVSDGRFATCYVPRCDAEKSIQAANNIADSYSYRMFLQQNGKALIDMERKHFVARNFCRPCSAQQVSWSDVRPLDR